MTTGLAPHGAAAEPPPELGPGTALPAYRVRARNLSRDSANRIHDDAVARRYGFAGGLVAGATIYGYLTGPLARAFGTTWLERGTVRVRFLRPVYDGEAITVVARIVGRSGGAAAGEIALEVEVRSATGEVAAGGVAGLSWGAERVAPDPAAYPLAPLPLAGVPPEPAALAGLGALGSPVLELAGDVVRRYAREVGDDLPVYLGTGRPGTGGPGPSPAAHPGLLLQQANRLLAANVSLGPWVHVASDVAHLGVAREGDHLTTRGRVAGTSERKGRHYVDLDALVVAEPDRPVLHVRHRAIYRLPDPPPA